MEEIEKKSEFLFYNSNDGNIKVQIILGDETVWATQKTMGEIFGTSRENITIHISNVLKDNELDVNSVCKEYLHTAKERQTKYNTNINKKSDTKAALFINQ